MKRFALSGGIAVAAILVLFLFAVPLVAQTQTENATGQTHSGGPGVEWIAPDNILGAPDDNCAATADVPSNSFIQVSFPAFAIPAGGMVTNVEVRVKYETASDHLVQLTLSGALSGSSKTLPMFDSTSFCSSTSFVSVSGNPAFWGISENNLRTAASAGNLGFRITQTAVTLDIDAVELIITFVGVNQPPVAMCQNVVKSANSICQASVSAAEVDNGSFDPDPGDSIGLSLSPSGPFSLGNTGVTLTVTDMSNEMDTCMATVTVNDDTPPVIMLVGASTTLECAIDTFVDPGFSASDNCDPSVPVIVGGATVDESTPGTYVITYDAVDDSGNNAVQKTRTVTVQDTIAPVIALNGDAEITLECGIDTYVEAGATASDECDTDVPVTIGGDVVDTGTPGTYVVTYDAVDDSGNNAVQVTRTVTVQDTTPPEIQCNSPDTIIPPDAPISFTATATDACAGDLTPTITAFDCYFINGAGKRVDKTESCEVEFSGDTVTILDSGGVKDNIEWTVTADDGNGNSTEQICHVLVVNPGKNKSKSTDDVIPEEFDKRLDFAQFASGDGFSSMLILHNPSETETAKGIVEFLDAAGQPLEIGVEDSAGAIEFRGRVRRWADFSIPPLGGVTFQSPEGQSLREGSVTVLSDIELAGMVRYSIRDLGATSFAGSAPVEAAIAAVRRKNGTNTGIALRNSESHEIDLVLSLRDEKGIEVEGGYALFRIGASSRLALVLDQLFPDADLEGFAGEVVIRSRDGRFSAAAIEFGDAPGQLNALPVTRIAKD